MVEKQNFDEEKMMVILEYCLLLVGKDFSRCFTFWQYKYNFVIFSKFYNFVLISLSSNSNIFSN